MTLTPMMRRAVEVARATRVAEEKAIQAERLERIQAAVHPPLANGELALALELPVTAVGRFKSDHPRARQALPDRFTRALIDVLCTGQAWLAVRAPLRPGDRREVLVCTEPEARRLGAGYTLVNVAGGQVEQRRPAAEWERADLWDLFEEAPPSKAPILPWRLLGPPEERLWLSPLGLGTMRLSTEGRPDEADALQVLHAAFERGLWLDTADVYARDETEIGHNERLIRQARSTWPGDRDSLFVATKGGLVRRGTRWLPDGRPEHLKAACQASLRALGMERIPLYQFHVVDGRVPLAESIDALADLRSAGLIQHIGLCNVTPEQITEAMGRVAVVSVQNPLSALEPANFTKTLGFCRLAGLGFVAHSPLGGFRKVEHLRADPALCTVAERHRTTPEAAALAWLLQAGSHVFAVPGATRVATVHSIADALTLRLTEQDFATLADRVPDGPDGPATDPGDVALILGTPAAGKSSRVQPFLDRGYVRLNRDEQGGTLDGLLPLLKTAAEAGARRFVLDNTYPTRTSRAAVVDTVAPFGLPVRTIFLDTPPEAAAFHAARRQLDRHGRLLSPAEIRTDDGPNTFPPAVIFRYARDFEAPIRGEGFASMETVPYRRWLGPEYRNKALILDYDGTLRLTRSGAIFPSDPEDVVVMPRRAEVLRRYQDAGYLLLGASNQAGVALGQVTEEAVVACIERTQAELGLTIETEFCPHPASRPPACYCRKPMPGMGVLFIERHRLDPGRCIMVGDRETDREFALASGFQFAWAEDFFR